METIKSILTRLAYKTTGFKSLYVIAVLVTLLLHDFTPENADVLIDLTRMVLGAKAVQYVAEAYLSKGGNDG